LAVWPIRRAAAGVLTDEEKWKPMASNPSGPRRAGDAAIHRLRAIWDWLTGPSTHIRGIGSRYRTRLLAGMLVIFTLLSLLDFTLSLITLRSLSPLVNPDFYVAGLAALVFLVAYGLNRAGRYGLAARLAIAMQSVAVFALAAITSLGLTPLWPFANLNILSFLAIPALFAGMLLPVADVAVHTAINAVVMLALAAALPGGSMLHLIHGPLLLYLAVSALVVGWTLHRNRLEEDRHVRIAESEARFRHFITHERDRTHLLRAACDILIEAAGYEAAWIALLDERGAVTRSVSAGLRESFPRTAAGLAQGVLQPCASEALAGPNVVVFPDVPAACPDVPSGELDGYAAVAARLAHAGRVYGVLVAYVAGSRLRDRRARNLFEGIVEDAAFALHSIELEEDLRALNETLEQTVEARTVELRRVKERVETILNHSPDAILLLGAEGTISTGNPAFYDLFEWGVDELYERPLSALVVDDHAGTISAAVEAIAAQHETIRLEVTARRRGGTTFDADVLLAPIRERETLLGIVCSIRNITSLKQLERMKDEFLTTAAHELRTPLTSIQGFSEILLNRDLTEDRQRHYFRIINQQAAWLAQIIEQLLDISRLEAGRGLEIRPEPVSMDSLVSDVLRAFVETNAHTFLVEGLTDAPPVRGDPFRLTQVVQNLVSNAVKYSPEGGTITVRGEVGPDRLAVSVSDEGIGMTPEEMDHLFERFYRADTVSTGGTGLGLAICKLIVEGHSGEIRAESKPGEGSTFTFTVPLAV
jgi:PAS domain S-box-containing protein